MTKEEHLERLTRLQTAISETLRWSRNSYAQTITRPRLLKELGQAIAEARRAGITEEDIDELVAELEITTGQRPINLEYLWDPRRMAKGWRNR